MWATPRLIRNTSTPERRGAGAKDPLIKSRAASRELVQQRVARDVSVTETGPISEDLERCAWFYQLQVEPTSFYGFGYPVAPLRALP